MTMPCDAPVAGHRPTRAHVDLDALVHNVQVARQFAGGRKLCAVVKANAYGHGLRRIAPALQEVGVEAFGVVFIDEAIMLREVGIHRPIWVWGSTLHGGFEALVRHRVTPVLGNLPQALALAELCRTHQISLDVQLEVDTGMARLGFGDDQIEALLAALPRLQPHLNVIGVMSHLAVADLPDDPFNAQQQAAFAALWRRLAGGGIAASCRHLANSAGTLAGPAEPSLADDFVRCGLLLYGCQPIRGRAVPQLRPVLALHSRIVALRQLAPHTPVSYGCSYRTPAGGPSRIATVPMGYADGYRRDFSNRGMVLAHGARVPVVGTVCMDMCMIDVTSLNDVAIGDPVVLLGNQASESLAAEELADWANTISYEIICGLATRVKRHYHRSGKPVAP